MANLTIEQAFETAVRHHQAGRFSEAENLYRRILALQPHHAKALNLWGLIAHQASQYETAEELIRQALAIAPQWPEAHYNLGIILKDREKVDEAVAEYHKAIALRPDYAEAYGNLGNALSAKRQFGEAADAFRKTIALRPDWAEAHNNLGIALNEAGKPIGAVHALRQAISIRPVYPEAYNNLGNALKNAGQLDESIAAYHTAIGLLPQFSDAISNLAAVMKERGLLDESIAAARRAIGIQPNFPEAHNNLGVALHEAGQLDEALISLRQAISLRAGYAEAYHNLGNVLKDQGQLDESIAAYRQALKLKPDFREAHSNLVYILHFHPEYDSTAIAEELRQWNRQFATSLAKFVQPHYPDRKPSQRLRVGYVSPDFHEHPVGRFLLPLFSNHDKSRFEIFAYSHGDISDGLTQQMRSCADCWRDIRGLSDPEAADRIRQDHIDILVDLTMHLARNRLLIFAQKPAPVQVTYLAYCSSTGLDAMDYRFSDPYLDPLEADDSIYSERTVRLPETYWCYSPTHLQMETGPPLSRDGGRLTFGSLNNFCKISEPTLLAWTSILLAVPDSELLLHALPGSHRQRLQDRLKQNGIPSDRVRFAGKVPTASYFRLYHEIDIALDPFPYGGGTTTCDALWMGVPVVSLVGKTATGRGGLSILSNLGLFELIAKSPEDYVNIATTLAGDRIGLTLLRSTLRGRMEQSPLMNAPRYAAGVEAAFIQMWRQK